MRPILQKTTYYKVVDLHIATSMIIAQADSGKYELNIQFTPEYEMSGRCRTKLRFRALTIQELVPLSIKSLPAELAQPLRDLVYDADDIEYTRLSSLEKTFNDPNKVTTLF